jgi:hypothetical protein
MSHMLYAITHDGDIQVIAFLFMFGVMNMFTPMVIMSTNEPSYDVKQRNIMRNMFITGVCIVFVSMGLYFMS